MKKLELVQLIKEVIQEEESFDIKSDEETDDVKPITDINKVMSVYSGKPGCMCGCRGKYTYASSHQEDASANRGYKVADNEVNDKVVKLMVNKINQLISSGNYTEAKESQAYVFVDTGDRYYAAYFKE